MARWRWGKAEAPVLDLSAFNCKLAKHCYALCSWSFPITKCSQIHYLEVCRAEKSYFHFLGEETEGQ